MTDTTYPSQRPWYKKVTVVVPAVPGTPVELVITPPYIPLTTKIVIHAIPTVAGGGHANVYYSVDDPETIATGAPTWTAWTPAEVAARTMGTIDQPVTALKLKALTKDATFILLI